MCSLIVFDIYCLQMFSYLLFICHFDYGNFTFNQAPSKYVSLLFITTYVTALVVTTLSFLSVLKSMTRHCTVRYFSSNMSCHETWLSGMKIYDDVSMEVELGEDSSCRRMFFDKLRKTLCQQLLSGFLLSKFQAAKGRLQIPIRHVQQQGRVRRGGAEGFGTPKQHFFNCSYDTHN